MKECDGMNITFSCFESGHLKKELIVQKKESILLQSDMMNVLKNAHYWAEIGTSICHS